MTISINQISTGTGLRINGAVWIVLEHQHVKPGKGPAFMRVKLKNIESDQVLERTFRPADKLDEVELQERKLQHMYNSGDDIHFMDNNSYEETIVPRAVIGDEIRFLQENLEVRATCFKDKVLKINLPIFIEADIKQTEPGVKGDSTKAGTKPATIDTGTTIQVPLFVNIGDQVKIDTRTGIYVERVKK